MNNSFISLAQYKELAKNKDLGKLDKLNLTPSQNFPVKNDTIELKTKFEQAQKQNGLAEKLADKIKNATNIGYGSKKIEQSINDVQQGKKTQEEVNKEIKNYRRSQENIAQTMGDLLSIAAAGLVFFGMHKNLTKGKSILQINEKEIYRLIKEIVENAKISNLPAQFQRIIKKYQDSKAQENLFKTLTSSRMVNAIAAVPAMLIGGFVKGNILKINRIGTEQYKAEIDKEKMSKEEIKKIKKQNKKAKKNANFRNTLSGGINGAMMPLVTLAGPLGVPLYVVLNSLSKYFIASREDKGEKSLNSYVENHKASKITNISSAAIMAIPLIQKGKYAKVLEQNAQKVTEELKNAKLTPVSKEGTVYEELQEFLFSDKKIAEIIEGNLSIEEKIKQLSDTNIFALKFKQIANDGDELTNALREKCPQTWSIEDAQKQINAAYGEGKYNLKKCVGVGTVAQTFVAQDRNGKNVCVKLIHKGIDEQKILKDKEAFIQMINSSSKTPQEKKFLIDNIENLALGIQSEVNLQNEMDAALKLAKTTKMANVVKPIEVKNNIYVMERADGISLADFKEFGNKMYFAKLFNDTEELQELNKQFKEKIGIDIDFDDLTKEETIKMIEQYQDILNEQFSKVDAKGKVIHGDIHPGNIFIDVKKLKAGDKKFFTLIDTGNTIEQTKEQALRFMNLTQYIKNADVDNIVDFVLDGAVLPKNMSKEKAHEELAKELNKVFFDKQTAIEIMTNDSLLALTDNIMKKLNIIPSTTQGSLLKAKKSSSNSLAELYIAYMEKFSEKNKKDTKGKNPTVVDKAMIATELASDIASLKSKDKIKKIGLERANLTQLTPSQRLSIKKSTNTPKSNSQDVLMYLLKQYKTNNIIEALGNFADQLGI